MFFSYGLLLGVGVGCVVDTATLMVGQVFFTISIIIVIISVIIITTIWSIFFCFSTLSDVGRQLRLDFAPPGVSALRSCSSLWRDQSGIILMVMMVIIVMMVMVMIMVMMVKVMMKKAIKRSIRSVLNNVCHIEIIVQTNNCDGG